MGVAGAESPAEAARRATVAALRVKLERLGAVAAPGAAPPARRPLPAPRVPRQPGFEPAQTRAGEAWVRSADVELSPLLEAAGDAGPATAQQLAALVRGPVAPRYDATAPVAVLDIESLGLRGSGVLAFLVGVGLLRGSRLEVHQVLLVEPGDEPAQLTAVLDLLDRSSLLLTYNGRTFDVPALRARCIVNRIDSTGLDSTPHGDLLGPVRRLFRDRLRGCTLRQAELSLLGMERIDDVPGQEAPARYRHWLHGAGPDVLAGVVRHNELDLCATAVLGYRLVAHVEGRMVDPVHPADRYLLALHLERLGARQRSELLLRDAMAARVPPWDRRAAQRLAVRLRRDGPNGRSEALALWRALWRGDPSDLRGARSLAIALERVGDHDEALAVSRSAHRLCTAMPAWRQNALRCAPPGGWPADWERRIDRLSRRAVQLALRTA